MPTNAADRTLGLTNIWQVLRKLLWEVELLKAIPERIRVDLPPAGVLQVKDARIYAAVNACSTSLALVDWLFHSVTSDAHLTAACRLVFPDGDLTSDKAFMESLRKISRPLNACHQVCNANKHFHLRKPEAGFKAMVGDVVYSNRQGATEVATFMHITHDARGSLLEGSIEEMLTSLVKWWQEKLSAIGIPDGELFFPDAASSCSR